MKETMYMGKCPCDNCFIRKMYARCFDKHISGEDCPYICEKYEDWKKEKLNDGEQKN